MNDVELQAAINNMPAEKVTLEYMESRIDRVVYDNITGTLTVCVIKLNNGFSVTGESACASPENFHEEIGRNLAYKHAVSKLWPLFGFLLCERKHLALQAK